MKRRGGARFMQPSRLAALRSVHRGLYNRPWRTPCLPVLSTCATAISVSHLSVRYFLPVLSVESIAHQCHLGANVHFCLLLYLFLSRFFVLLTFTLCVTLTVQACSIAFDKALWYDVWFFGRVCSCGVSVPTDLITGDVFGVDVRYDMIDKVHIEIICGFPCMLDVSCSCMGFISCCFWCWIKRSVVA